MGSGLGLLGLVGTKWCNVNKFIFSDCHEHVLQKLCANIILNTLPQCDSTTRESLDLSFQPVTSNDQPGKSDRFCDFPPGNVPESWSESKGGEHSKSIQTKCLSHEHPSLKNLFSLTLEELLQTYCCDIEAPNTEWSKTKCFNHNKRIWLSELDWERFSEDDVRSSCFQDVDVILATGNNDIMAGHYYFMAGGGGQVCMNI